MSYYYILLCISVIISSLAHTSLKLGAAQLNSVSFASLQDVMQALNVWLFLGVLGHVVSLVLWVYCLMHVKLSVAYPFLALGYVFIAFLSYSFLGESISINKAVGMVLIVIGIIFITKA